MYTIYTVYENCLIKLVNASTVKPVYNNHQKDKIAIIGGPMSPYAE